MILLLRMPQNQLNIDNFSMSDDLCCEGDKSYYTRVTLA